MGFYKRCRKWTLFAFNLIFLLVGGVLITLGTLYRVHFKDIDSAIPRSYYYFASLPITIIVLGTIISLTCIFGFWGLFRKTSCLLQTNSVILLAIFILQVVLSIVTFVQMSNKDQLAQDVNKTIDNLFNKNTTEDKELIDFIQEKIECCGTYGPKFWTKIPKSCCEEQDCKQSMYQDGCQSGFYNFLLSTVRISGITILVLSATQVIGATLSLSLANAIRNHNRRYQYYYK